MEMRSTLSMKLLLVFWGGDRMLDGMVVSNVNWIGEKGSLGHPIQPYHIITPKRRPIVSFLVLHILSWHTHTRTSHSIRVTRDHAITMSIRWQRHCFSLEAMFYVASSSSFSFTTSAHTLGMRLIDLNLGSSTVIFKIIFLEHNAIFLIENQVINISISQQNSNQSTLPSALNASTFPLIKF